MYQPLIKFHPYPAIITQVLRIFVLPNFKVGRSHSGRSGRRRSPARIVPAGGAAPSAGDADRRKPIFETNKNDSPK